MGKLPLCAFLILLVALDLQARERSFDFAGDAMRGDTAISYSGILTPENESLDQLLTARQVVSRSESNTWSGLARLGKLNLTGTQFPSSYWDIEGGTAFSRKLDDRRQWGVNASVGSASDRPFDSLGETVFRVTGFYRLPSGELNSWILAVNYSNNRSFANNIPIPGAAYMIRNHEKTLFALLGFPFASFNYGGFMSDWGLRASYIFPYLVTTRLSRRLFGPIRAYAVFDWDQTAWLPADRGGVRERLFFESQNAGGGLTLPLSRSVTLDLSGGYSFNRRAFVAESVLRAKGASQHFDASPYASASMSMNF